LHARFTTAEDNTFYKTLAVFEKVNYAGPADFISGGGRQQ